MQLIKAVIMQHFKHFKRKKNLEFGTFWINFEMRNPNGLTPFHFLNVIMDKLKLFNCLFTSFLALKSKGDFFGGVISNNCELHPRFFFAIMPIFLNHYQALKSHEEEHFFSPKKILGNFTTKTNLWGNSLYFK